MLRGSFRSEVLIQLHSGLSFLYLGMPLFWILIARLLPAESRRLLVLIAAYADPVMMGQIFTGAFLARERDQGIIEALAVSPVGPGIWLFSRVCLIGIQGVFGAVLMVTGSGITFNPVLLVPSVFLAAVSGALIGMILALPFDDILSYFVLEGIASALVSLPAAFLVVKPSLFWIIPGPAASGWMAISTALHSRIGAGPEVPALTALVLWSLCLFVLARKLYLRAYFRRPGKGGTR